MIFNVAVRPEAEPDVYEARDYYAAISVDLAERFEANFQATATSLAEFPKRHREVGGSNPPATRARVGDIRAVCEPLGA